MLIRIFFQSIEMNTKTLDSMHNVVCDLNFVQTKDTNDYFATFRDGSIIFSMYTC